MGITHNVYSRRKAVLEDRACTKHPLPCRRQAFDNHELVIMLSSPDTRTAINDNNSGPQQTTNHAITDDCYNKPNNQSWRCSTTKTTTTEDRNKQTITQSPTINYYSLTIHYGASIT